MADWDQIYVRQQREFAVLGILRSCVVMPVDHRTDGTGRYPEPVALSAYQPCPG